MTNALKELHLVISVFSLNKFNVQGYSLKNLRRHIIKPSNSLISIIVELYLIFRIKCEICCPENDWSTNTHRCYLRIYEAHYRFESSTLDFKCIYLSVTAMITSLNLSSDPCNNFYEFVCGNFQKDRLVRDLDNVTQLTIMEEGMKAQNMKLLEEKNKADEPKFARRMKRLYSKCINTSEYIRNKILIQKYLILHKI